MGTGYPVGCRYPPGVPALNLGGCQVRCAWGYRFLEVGILIHAGSHRLHRCRASFSTSPVLWVSFGTSSPPNYLEEEWEAFTSWVPFSQSHYWRILGVSTCYRLERRSHYTWVILHLEGTSSDLGWNSPPLGLTSDPGWVCCLSRATLGISLPLGRGSCSRQGEQVDACLLSIDSL